MFRKIRTFSTNQDFQHFSHKFLDIATPPILAFTYGISSTVASTYNNTITMNNHDIQLKSFEKSLDNLDINMKERFYRVDEDIKSFKDEIKEDIKSFKDEIKEDIKSLKDEIREGFRTKK